jgi:rhodanese-related sulfurtransferase
MGLFSQLFGSSSLPSVDAAQAQIRLHQTPAPLLLDVRQPDEYQAGHIEGAQLMPLGELGQRLQELPAGREIICVCQSGSRSSHATRELVARGYRATNLNGGMIAWTRAGLPIRKGAAR